MTTRRWTPWVTLALALGSGVPAWAQTPPDATTTAPAAGAERRALRDPQSGQFINGPVETAPAAGARSRDAQPGGALRADEMNDRMLQFMQRQGATPHPGNPRVLQLSPEHLSATVIRRSADGTLVSQCVTGEPEAAHRLHAPAVNVQALRRSADAK